MDHGELPFPDAELAMPITVVQRGSAGLDSTMLEEDTDEIEFFLLRMGAPATTRQIENELARCNLRLPTFHRIAVFEKESKVTGFVPGPLLQLPNGSVIVVYLKEWREIDMNHNPEHKWPADCWFVGVLNRGGG